jgi:hypothetical protein
MGYLFCDPTLIHFCVLFLSRTEGTERSIMLRKKAMREKEEECEMHKYKYAVIRIHLPDGVLLQVIKYF